jgi:imidazole glycerol-phosphate synthase subunit HisF
MLAKRIIACLDVKDGRVVKGTNFVELKDAGDPVELAKMYDKQGADECVFLDITASSDKRNVLLDLINKCAKELFIPFTVGGGINDISTIKACLKAGADKVSINTAAVKNPTLIQDASKEFGSQAIVVAVDAKKVESISDKIYPIKDVQCDVHSKWEIFTHGGRYPTGIDALKWASYMQKLGAGELLLTSMDKDGTKSGYDIELTKAISDIVTIPVIASGGAGELAHISDVLHVCDAALLASLLHFRILSVDKIKTHCKNHNFIIRK